MVAQATGAGGDGDDISATRALGASPGGWPGQSAEHRHDGPALLRPGPAVPPSRSASCSSPDSASLPPPRAALPPPGAGGGARAAQVTDARKRADGGEPEVWTAGASASVRGVRSPDRSSAAAAGAVRPSRRRALVLLSAMAPHRPGRPPAPRSLDPWILGALPSLSLPRLPAAHGARPGSNCYNLRGWLAPVRGDSVRVRARYRGPGQTAQCTYSQACSMKASSLT